MDDKSKKELPPSIKELVRGLGNAKRQEIINTKPIGKSTPHCNLSDFLLMGKNWTEGEDFNLFLGSNRLGEDWDAISKNIPNRTAEQCKLRWEFLITPSLLKKTILETPKKRELVGSSLNTSQGPSSSKLQKLETSKEILPQAQLPNFSPPKDETPHSLSQSEGVSNILFSEIKGNSDFKNNSLQELSANLQNFFTDINTSELPLPEPKKIKTTNLSNTPSLSAPTNSNQADVGKSKYSNLLQNPSTETLLNKIVASYTSGKDEAKESILAIANLLQQNPQLIPAIRLLESITMQHSEDANSSVVSGAEEIDEAKTGKRPPLVDSNESDDGLSFILSQDNKVASTQIFPEDNIESNVVDSPCQKLLYRFATQDLPDELEDDGDFVHNEAGQDLEYDENLHVTKKELQSLYEDSEDATKSATICKLRKPIKDEEQNKDTLFSLNILNRIRVQQQQNLQLVLQAFAIEARFRGAESEKAVYWKSRALHIKRLNDYGQLQAKAQSDDMEESPQTEDFLSFFTVPGADYMDAMIEIFANPPESYNPINTTKVMSKSRLAAAAITRRDWIELYPESEFCAPNSPRNVVDKARCITVLINEVFSPIFSKHLQPFFTAVKKRDRPIFTPGEDKLFTIGLYKFGDDWPSIRSHVLPARASRQLENRFNNLKSRRAEFNPVQQYYLRQIKPLDLKEEDLLSQGIQAYGRKFRLISQRMMPNRPSFVLKKAWREMELRKIVLSRPIFLDQYN